MKYSPTSKGFYAESLLPDYEAAGTLPTDVVTVSNEAEVAIRAALANSETPVLSNGVWTFIPYVPSESELISAAEQKRAAALTLAAQQITILAEATDPDIIPEPMESDKVLLLSWQKYRQAVRAVVVTVNPIAWPLQPALA